MDYLSFDPASCKFPRPRVPVLPALSRHSLGRQAAAAPSAAQHADPRHFSRGRYALAQACALSGVGPGGALLAPAYHCRTMLDPALRWGAAVQLYPIQADLSPDLDALAALLTAPAQPVKAVLATHYFGFPQALQALSELCARANVTLIEDCSHAMFGNVGRTGRYAVASPYKFFPSPDGGMLWANGGARLPDAAGNAPGPLNEVKAVWHALQRRGSAPLEPQAIPRETQAARMDGASVGRQVSTHHTMTSQQYDSTEEYSSGLAWSRWIMRHTNSRRLVLLRRRNYRRWATAVAGLPHGRALFPALGDNAAPYMFPLLIDHPQFHFYLLKRLGVPVWRWDDMAVSNCSVASQYRLRLLHLPCHQELTDRQMSWMIAAVQHVLRQDPTPTT
jgi:hypothetical protein